MPRNPLPHPRPSSACPPWHVARWTRQLSNYKRALNYLLAKERRRRRVAEKKASQNKMQTLKLQRRLAKILSEIATVQPVKSDPYLKVEMED